MTAGTTILGVWAMPSWPASVFQITNSQDVVRFGWGSSLVNKKQNYQIASYDLCEDHTCNRTEFILTTWRRQWSG